MTPPSDGSFWGEIKADAGSYNFQWEINGQHGTGTVMFQANGKPKMQLIGIRDMHGNEIEADPAMQRQLQQQAMAFIGQGIVDSNVSSWIYSVSWKATTSNARRALEKTGYWGKQAAGSDLPRPRHQAVPASPIAQRRSSSPASGAPGVARLTRVRIPKTAARREAMEEAGYQGDLTMLPLYVFRDEDFRYSNFLAVVDQRVQASA